MTADTYITVQNDAWDAIAYRLWGEERLFPALIAANLEHLDTVLFSPGVTLRVPPKPVQASKQEPVPWM